MQPNATGKIGQDVRGAARHREPKHIRRLEIAACGEGEASNRSIAAANCGGPFDFWRNGDKRIPTVGTIPSQAVGAEANRSATWPILDQVFERRCGRSVAIDRAADEPFGFFLIGLGEVGALLQAKFQGLAAGVEKDAGSALVT